jgi:hypothetical protein
MHGAISPLPTTPSWRGAQLKNKGNFIHFGNKVRKAFGATRDDLTEQCRILSNEELCDFYRSSSITGA